MNLDQALQIIKSNKNKIQELFSVEKIGVFGSTARNNAATNSDLDIYVEFKEKDADNVLGLMVYLDELFKTKIDMVYKHKYNNPSLIKNIQKEVIYG